MTRHQMSTIAFLACTLSLPLVSHAQDPVPQFLDVTPTATAYGMDMSGGDNHFTHDNNGGHPQGKDDRNHNGHSQLCTAVNDEGKHHAKDKPGTGACTTLYPRYAFVANSADDSISTYMVDAPTGRLKYIGKAGAPGGYQLYGITADSSGKYVYVTAREGGVVFQYTAGTDGSLTLMAPPTVAAGTDPQSVTLSPDDKYAYVVNNGSNDVSQYMVSADGRLAPMDPPSVAVGEHPNRITVDPSGKYAYVSNSGNYIHQGTVYQYRINADGSLAPLDPATIATGVSPGSVAIHPDGRHAYVTGRNSISQYLIGAGGSMTPMDTPVVAVNGSPGSMAIDPKGKYAYVVNAGGPILQFTIGQDGSLAPMATPWVGAGVRPSSVTVDPSGKYVYVVNSINDDGGNSISQYAIGTDGSLTPLSPATVASQQNPSAMVLTGGATPVVPVPKYTYVANAGGTTVSQYTIGADGSLAQMSHPAAAAGNRPYAVAVDPRGKYAYVANYLDNTVSQFNIGPDGSLTPMATAAVATGNGPQFLAVDTAGRYLYVANIYSSDIWQYRIGIDGSLTANSPATIAAGAYPLFITVDPSGQYVYVVNAGTAGGSVSQYRINQRGPNDGTLVPIGDPTDADMYPQAIAFDPSGRYAYVANVSSNDVSQYIIGVGGRLAPMAPPSVTAGEGPNSVTVDPSGKYVYVANFGGKTDSSQNVSQYTLGVNGTLAPMTPPSVAADLSSHFVVVDPSGKYAYVVNATSNSVSQYTIGTGGLLSPMGTPAAAAGTNPISATTLGTWQFAPEALCEPKPAGCHGRERVKGHHGHDHDQAHDDDRDRGHDGY